MACTDLSPLLAILAILGSAILFGVCNVMVKLVRVGAVPGPGGHHGPLHHRLLPVRAPRPPRLLHYPLQGRGEGGLEAGKEWLGALPQGQEVCPGGEVGAGGDPPGHPLPRGAAHPPRSPRARHYSLTPSRRCQHDLRCSPNMDSSHRAGLPQGTTEDD